MRKNLRRKLNKESAVAAEAGATAPQPPRFTKVDAK